MPSLPRRLLLLLILVLLPLQGWASARMMAPTMAALVVADAHCNGMEQPPSVPRQQADCTDCSQCLACHPPLPMPQPASVPHRPLPPQPGVQWAGTLSPQPPTRPPIHL